MNAHNYPHRGGFAHCTLPLSLPTAGLLACRDNVYARPGCPLTRSRLRLLRQDLSLVLRPTAIADQDSCATWFPVLTRKKYHRELVIVGRRTWDVN